MTNIVRIYIRDKFTGKLISLKLKEETHINRVQEILKKHYEHLKDKSFLVYFKDEQISGNFTLKQLVEEKGYDQKSKLEIRETNKTVPKTAMLREMQAPPNFIQMMRKGGKSFDRAVMEIMIRRKALSRDVVEEAFQEAKSNNISLTTLLIEKSYLTEKDVLTNISHQLEIQSVDLENVTISEQVLSLIPKQEAEYYGVIPVRFSQNTLHVAMSNPFDEKKLHDLRTLTGKSIEPALATEVMLKSKIESLYKDADSDLGSLVIKDGQKVDPTQVSMDEFDAATIWADKSDEMESVSTSNSMLAIKDGKKVDLNEVSDEEFTAATIWGDKSEELIGEDIEPELDDDDDNVQAAVPLAEGASDSGTAFAIKDGQKVDPTQVNADEFEAATIWADKSDEFESVDAAPEPEPLPEPVAEPTISETEASSEAQTTNVEDPVAMPSDMELDGMSEMAGGDISDMDLDSIEEGDATDGTAPASPDDIWDAPTVATKRGDLGDLNTDGVDDGLYDGAIGEDDLGVSLSGDGQSVDMDDPLGMEEPLDSDGALDMDGFLAGGPEDESSDDVKTERVSMEKVHKVTKSLQEMNRNKSKEERDENRKIMENLIEKTAELSDEATIPQMESVSSGEVATLDENESESEVGDFVATQKMPKMKLSPTEHEELMRASQQLKKANRNSQDEEEEETIDESAVNEDGKDLAPDEDSSESPMEQADKSVATGAKEKSVSSQEEDAAEIASPTETKVAETPASSPSAAPAPMPAPAPVMSAPQEKTPVFKKIARNTLLRYYRKMYPFQTFPLELNFSKEELVASNTSEKVAEVTGGSKVVVSEADSVVQVSAHIPGCLSVPSVVNVDIQPAESQAKMWLTPLATGKVEEGCVEVSYHGKVIKTIPVKVKVAEQWMAKMSFMTGCVIPVVSLAIESGDSSWQSLPQLLQRLLNELNTIAVPLGGIFNLGLTVGVSLFALSGLFYLLGKSKKAVPESDQINLSAQGV